MLARRKKWRRSVAVASESSNFTPLSLCDRCKPVTERSHEIRAAPRFQGLPKPEHVTQVRLSGHPDGQVERLSADLARLIDIGALHVGDAECNTA